MPDPTPVVAPAPVVVSEPVAPAPVVAADPFASLTEAVVSDPFAAIAAEPVERPSWSEVARKYNATREGR